VERYVIPKICDNDTNTLLFFQSQKFKMVI